MNKEILITNYDPNLLKQARVLANLDDDFFEKNDTIDLEEIYKYENNDSVEPIDIFLIAYLFVTYKEEAEKKGVQFRLSLTSDILKPHIKGLEYQEFIVTHKNYKGMPVNRKANGTIKWVATIKSDEGLERVEFWENKRKELGIAAGHVLDSGVRQKVAFANHPSKVHVCLFSGSELSIEYRFPSPNRIDLLNKHYDQDLKYYDLDIYEVARLLYDMDCCKILSQVFKIEGAFESLHDLLDILKKEFVEKEYSPFVSPGAMSNSPDRFDGYHSYNSDVRAITDTGRYAENLKRYTQDRRVYEMWSGGNWKMADRLYATFVKNGVSPDHIGPMSLGFAHRPKFQPMTKNENTAKGNRMTFDDVILLISDEEKGEEVITWHSKFIWDKLKNKVENNDDAIKLSGMMRKNLHHVLIIFSLINEKGFDDFLKQFLNPDYSYYDYEFLGFNPKTGSYQEVITKELKGKNQSNNVDRYFRIAFEKLVYYSDKDNRKNKIWGSESITQSVNQLLALLSKNRPDEALILLNQTIEDLSEIAHKNW